MRVITTILIICALILVAGCIGKESKLEYYAKRCPQDTILIYGDIEKLNKIESNLLEKSNEKLDIIPGLSTLLNEYFSQKNIMVKIGLGDIKEMIIVTPNIRSTSYYYIFSLYDIMYSGYYILVGEFNLNEAKAKFKEYGIPEGDRYNGFTIYGSPSRFFAISDDGKYIVMHIGGYYSSRYVLDYLSGKMIESSLYTQYKEIIQKLPSDAALYALMEPAYAVPKWQKEDVEKIGIEKVGIAILVEDKKVKYIVVCEFKDEKKADGFTNKIKDYIETYEKFNFRKEGKYIIIELEKTIN